MHHFDRLRIFLPYIFYKYVYFLYLCSATILGQSLNSQHEDEFHYRGNSARDWVCY